MKGMFQTFGLDVFKMNRVARRTLYTSRLQNRCVMWFDFEKSRAPKLRRPTLVVAVSTSLPQYRSLYSQARELGEYMLKKMEFDKIASVRSSAFPPEVFVRDDGVSSLPECSFHLSKGKEELVLFTGDSSPMDDQYEFAKLVLDYARELGVKELYSIGARWT